MSLTTALPPLPPAAPVAVSTFYKTGSYQTGDLNLPPLVTIFTPKPECKARWVLPAPESSPIIVYSTNPENKGGSLGDAYYVSCQPQLGAEYYRPGVCPEDRSIASLNEYRLVNDKSSSTYWDAYCCPSGMTMSPGTNSMCYSTFTTPLTAYAPLTTSVPGARVFTAYWWLSNLSTGSPSYTTTSNSTLVPFGEARADAIWVGWDTEDLTKFPPAYASSLAKRIGVPFTPTAVPAGVSAGISAAVTSSPVPGLSSNLPTETASSDSSGGLSTGAKAGIGVGAALVFVLVLGLLALTLLMRRKLERQKSASTGNEDAAANPSEMEAADQQDRDRKSYLDGQWRSEAAVDTERRELDTKDVRVFSGPPVELEAETVGHEKSSV